MRLLLFDTETSGFRGGGNRVLQFGGLVVKLNAAHATFTIQQFSALINNDVPINEKAFEVHGISNDMVKHGIPESALANWFHGQCEKADLLVAHNLKFDYPWMVDMLERVNKRMPVVRTYCTMEESKSIVQCPPTPAMVRSGRKGFKNPRLDEAYKHFTGKTLSGAHDAMVDTKACLEVFLGIQKHKSGLAKD